MPASAGACGIGGSHPEPLHLLVTEVGAQTGALECPAKDRCLAGIAQARQPEVITPRAEQRSSRSGASPQLAADGGWRLEPERLLCERVLHVDLPARVHA